VNCSAENGGASLADETPTTPRHRPDRVAGRGSRGDPRDPGDGLWSGSRLDATEH